MRRKVLLALAVATALTGCGRREYEDGRPPQKAAAEAEAVLSMGQVDLVPDTPFFTVPVGYNLGLGGSYSSGRRADERNRLIVDTRTGVSRRLLPDNNRRIVRWDDFSGERGRAVRASRDPVAAPDRPGGPAFAAIVREGPAEGDEQPRYAVMIGRFDGPTTWASQGLVGVMELWRLETGEVAMVVETENGTFYRSYDPSTLRKKLDTPIKI